MKWQNIFKFGKKTKTVSPKIIELEYMGKKQKALLYIPYGTHMNFPNDGLVGILADQGNEESLFAIPTDLESRDDLPENGLSYGIPGRTARVTFFDNDKIGIYNSVISMLEILEGLIDVIKAIQTTGAPTNHVLNPASITELEAYKLQIEGLLNGS